MIIIKTNIASAINRSKKDFFFYDLDDNNNVTNWILSNNYREGRKAFQKFRVVETIKLQTETITIK